MLVVVPNVLDASQIVSLRERLDHVNEAWVDGRVTAGYQGAPVKFNQQIDERSEVAHACQRIIVSALERNPLFISAILPNTIYPPMAACASTRTTGGRSGPTCRRPCS
jgi:PKHD-type hydroxylase